MFNITTTIRPSLRMLVFFGFYALFKRTIFIQVFAVFQRFLAQLNFKLERLKNLTSYIGTHIISLRIKFTPLNEIFNINYSYRDCNRQQLLNRNNDEIKMTLNQIQEMTMFGSNFVEFKAILSLNVASKGSVKYLKVSF